MKIQEFRDKMKSADRAALEKIAADLYRRLPKALKEQELDDAIEQMLKGEAAPKASAKKGRIPFDELKGMIDTFLSHVDAGYYIEPNRVVPKAKRSKWRFTVMRFIKQLDMIQPDDEHAEEAAQLYLGIYERLAYGSAYYILPSEDPFASIQWRQGDCYPVMAARYFATGFSDVKILNMLRAATSTFVDRWTLHDEMEVAFIRELRTRDMRERAYAIAKEEVRRIETEELPAVKKSDYHDDYYIRDKINEISATIVGLGIALFEEEDALAFFEQHYDERNREVKLYILLRYIDCFGGNDVLWIKTYKDAVNRGVKPRERLVEMYHKRQVG